MREKQKKSEGRTKIGRRGFMAIAALLTAKSHAAAAEQAGISEATLARWLNNDDFKGEYRRARDRAFDSAITSLECAMTGAVDKLRERLHSEREGDEIRAASVLLDLGLRVRQHFDHEARLAELEKIIEDLKNEQPASETH